MLEICALTDTLILDEEGVYDPAHFNDRLTCWRARTAGGRLRLIATLHDPAVIRKILAHLGGAESGQSPGPAPPAS